MIKPLLLETLKSHLDQPQAGGNRITMFSLKEMCDQTLALYSNGSIS